MNVDLHWAVVNQMEAEGLSMSDQIGQYRQRKMAAQDPGNMMRFWSLTADFWEGVEDFIESRIKWRVELFVQRQVLHEDVSIADIRRYRYVQKN